MIELPEKSLIADLTEKPGLDDAKLELIAQVFPGVFPSPLPRVGAPSNVGPVPVYTGGFDLVTRQRLSLRHFQTLHPEAKVGMRLTDPIAPFENCLSRLVHPNHPARMNMTLIGQLYLQAWAWYIHGGP